TPRKPPPFPTRRSSDLETWNVSTPQARATALLGLADLIEEHAEELADLESADAGKPRAGVIGDELEVMADNLRFFAGAARLPERSEEHTSELQSRENLV